MERFVSFIQKTSSTEATIAVNLDILTSNKYIDILIHIFCKKKFFEKRASYCQNTLLKHFLLLLKWMKMMQFLDINPHAPERLLHNSIWNWPFFSHLFVKTKFFKGLIIRLKNSTPSPWKRRKTTSSATFLRNRRVRVNENSQSC